jgi:hypothetical protein
MYDSFQKQLEDLQRSYMQLSKQQGPAILQSQTKHEILRVPGMDAAKPWAKENLNPGESAVLFHENEDQFYIVSKSQDGIVQPLLLGKYTVEPEPPKPEYATKQDFAKLEAMLKQLLEKEDKT